MPPRYVILAIVLVWVATSIWLFQRELWPELKSGEPPAFVIDKTDEVKRARPSTPWTVTHHGPDGKANYQLQASVSYQAADDTFAHEATLRPKMGTVLEQFVPPRDITSMSVYRASRAGRLLELAIGVRYQPAQGDEQRARFVGATRDRIFSAYREFERGPTGQPAAPRHVDLEPVAVSHHGIVIDPLHPFNRMRDLRTGRTWQVPAVDPMALDATSPALQVLKARVEDDDEVLRWKDRDWPCRRIRYEPVDDGPITSLITWFRAVDGLVIQQEAYLHGERWLLVREQEW